MTCNKLIEIPLCIVEQNGNTFYFGKMKASDLIEIYTVNPAKYDIRKNASLRPEEQEFRFNQRIADLEAGKSQFSSETGHQRGLSRDRIKEIATYLNESKKFAIFPNAIIATCDLNSDLGESIEEFKELMEKDWTIGAYLVKLEKVDNNLLHTHTLYITNKSESLIIIDGQHRIEGILRSDINRNDFELLVTFILSADRATIAKHFYTVNYNQKPVNKSLLYHLMGEFGTDLQEVSYLHEIIIALNELDFSPFHNRVKMLGTRDHSLTPEERHKMNLSQAFLVDYMKYMITWDSTKQYKKQRPKLLPIFYWYYKNSGHASMLRFILRFFTAAKKVHPAIGDPDSPLGKTLGIGAMLYFMSDFFVKLACTKDFFSNPENIDAIRAEDLKLLLLGIEQVDNKEFPSSGAAGVGKLYKKLVELCKWLNDDSVDSLENMKGRFLQWVNSALK